MTGPGSDPKFSLTLYFMYNILPRRCCRSSSSLLRPQCRTYASKAKRAKQESAREDPEVRKLQSLGRRLIDSQEVNVLDQVGGRKRKWDRAAIQFERRGVATDPRISSVQGSEFAWDDSKNEIDLKPGDYIEIGGYARVPFPSVRPLITCKATPATLPVALCSARSTRRVICSSCR